MFAARVWFKKQERARNRLRKTNLDKDCVLFPALTTDRVSRVVSNLFD